MYGRLEELIGDLELKETATIKDLRAGLRDLIVEEALAGANRKRRDNPNPRLEVEMPGQTSIEAALEEKG